ncbi:MAG: hypothetical protein ACR2PR_11160 [Pseudohongiellaceae bacterium]
MKPQIILSQKNNISYLFMADKKCAGQQGKTTTNFLQSIHRRARQLGKNVRDGVTYQQQPPVKNRRTRQQMSIHNMRDALASLFSQKEKRGIFPPQKTLYTKTSAI